VGHVRRVERDGRTLVLKRIPDPARHDAEVSALSALAGGPLPVPELVEVGPGSILMTHLPGDRLDEVDAGRRLSGLQASMAHLRSLHRMPAPAGLPGPPDDALVVRRYRAAGGPPLPLVLPPPRPPVFCHGDWTDGNLLAGAGEITAVVDWEAAHAGDPVRELARVAWGAARKDARSFDAVVTAYGADPAEVHAWSALHAAALWLWFAEAGPPEYLAQLTAELTTWPAPGDERSG
jgi:aminoglycoside phosphotransferase (APT) family kinase protein